MNSKAIRLILLPVIILLVNAKIHAQCDSTNTEISSKIRFLGDWNADGKPDYLIDSDTVSDEILKFVKEALPESVNILNSPYFDPNVQPNIVLTKKTELFLTFVYEAAGWKNTLGFYTYDKDNPPATYEDIDSLVVVFPHVDSLKALKSGYKVSLGKYEAGTGIGYFLISRGWKGDTICLSKGNHIVFTDKNLNTFTDDEYKQQTVLLHYEDGGQNKLILGIEDQPRPNADNDFNDAVFYITAKDFTAVDTTDIPKIPMAEIFGDTVLCSDDAVATINIEFTGAPPFDVVYNNGTEDVEVNGINADSYSFQTSIRDTFRLVSVSNANGLGIVKGQAVVQQSAINAYWTNDGLGVCEDVMNTTAQITLEGFEPFTLVYKEDGSESTVDSISGNSYEIPVKVGSQYLLAEIHDAYCSAILKDTLSINKLDKPTASIGNIDTTVCAGTTYQLKVEFEGNAPYTYIYSKNGVNDTLTTVEPSAFIEITENAEIISLEVMDANCENTEVTGSAKIAFRDLPSVKVDASDNTTCGNNEATINLTFTGIGPWSFELKKGDAITSYSSSNDTYQLQLHDGGQYQVVNLADATCENPTAENFEIVNYDTPTALISGSTSICEGVEASLTVELTGTAPFEFTYTDGANDYTVNTSESEFVIKTSDAGTYTLKSVSDANCSGTVDGEAIVENTTKPEVNFYGENFICGTGEATLTLEFTGTAPYNFTLKNGDSETNYTSESDKFDVAVSEPGTYEVINFSDANCSGNTAQTVAVEKADNPGASIALDGSGELCGDEKATIVISLSGTAPFTLTYTDGKEEHTVTTSENEYVFETSVAGIYSVLSVSDAKCSGAGTGEVEVKDLAAELNGEIAGEDQVCEDGDDIALHYTGTGDIVDFSWSTDGAGILTANSASDASYAPAEGETGEIRFSLEVSNQCATKTFEKSIEIVPTPVATFTLFPEDLLTNTDITFTADNDGYESYAWDFGDGSTGAGNPATHTYDQPGKYQILLTVENSGCIGEASGEGVVKTKNDLYVPNVFNPNAMNTENQVVKVYGTNVSEDGFSFKIVNRWGNIMYQTNSFAVANGQGWGGKEYNSNEMQSLSAFTYILKGKFNDGETFEKTGTITILQ